jgi:hypothetical protein
MLAQPSDRRGNDRRAVPDRRFVEDRRIIDRRQSLVPVQVEQRMGIDRRLLNERRASEDRRWWMDRRLAGASLGMHLRTAVELLERVADSGPLADERRRDLDGAMFRLKFALDRLEEDPDAKS